jgi:hypothetical protein
MKKLLKIYKPFLLSFIFSIFVASSNAYAVCTNQVPSILNPTCDPTREVTVGTIINRVIKVLPIAIALIAIAMIIRGAIKIMTSDDAEKRAEGFKIIINAAIGAVVFYSIYIILYLVEQFTGAELLIF